MQRIDILWRDIPSQVLIKRGRDRGKYMLTARFQEAIDRAAMRAGKGGSDAYLEATPFTSAHRCAVDGLLKAGGQHVLAALTAALDQHL